MDFIKDVKKRVLELVPQNAEVSSVDLEGPEIAIYTKNPKAFFEGENYVSKIAFEIKKRVNIRTDKSLLLEEDQAKKKILEIIPKDADVKEIMFNTAFSEVVIESIKPGLVIGKGGETSKKIILETGWTPKIIRAPTTPSEILKGLRYHLHKHSLERKKFLQKTAEKIYGKPPDLSSWVRLTALGSFREVGRSCILVETRDTKVIMDCGINVASRDDPYPYLDAIRFPIQELDAIVLSHAHLDHSGFIPYLYKVGYDGPIYATEPTRDLAALLQFDYIEVYAKEGKEAPYTERDVKEAIKHTITRDYREVTDIAPDMRLTFQNAAHILGSASVHLHIGEGAHNLVYSADIKYGFTRLFDAVDIKYPRLETLILESTYGARDDIHPQRQDAEERLIKVINETLQQGGNVLIPVFAVGRAQEMLLVIENAYRNGQLINPKVYVDGMTREASAIHTAYPEYLRKNVQRRVLQNDSPFTSEIFQPVNTKDRDSIIQNGGAIIVASSGMLTGGPSVYYLHKLADDPRNTLIFVGYQGEGSLGRKLQAGIKTTPITVENGKTKELQIKMRVETVEGYSVPFETEIFVKENNEFRIEQIGKIAGRLIEKEKEGIAELNGIQVAAFDKEGKIEMMPASQIIKHKTKESHIKITTKSGKEIQVSKGHSLFSLKNGKIESIKGKELKEKDNILIAARLPQPNSINTVDFSEFAHELGYSRNGNKLEPSKGGNNHSFINAQCNDMDSLAKFLGYYAAEGHKEKGRSHRAVLSFGSHETEIIKDACNAIEKIFGIKPTFFKPHKTAVQIRASNKVLVKFLEKIRVGENAPTKRVPEIVFNLPFESQKEFLKAYFVGDGYDYKNGGKGYLAAKSASKKLLSDLSYLLLQHGIISRMKGPYKEKERMLNGNKIKETIAYKIYIAEKEFEKIERITGYAPFALPTKEICLEKISKLVQGRKLKKLASDYIRNYTKKGRHYIGLQVIKKFLGNLNEEKATAEEKEIIKTLKSLTEGDIALDEITKIEEVQKPKFEYDISVPEAENFCGGIGGIMLHNSGHSDRPQLVSYVQNLKPKPKRILVNHGERSKTIELSKYLSQRFALSANAIKNLETVRLK